MLYLGNFIAHCRAVFECLPAFDASGTIDIETGKLIVRARGRQLELIPQFVSVKETGTSFTPKLTNDSQMFLGWRPYLNRIWPIAVDKLQFKQFCETNALRAPKRYENPTEVTSDALIKRSHGSMGQSVGAPMTSTQVRSASLQLVHGEYLDQFVRGETAKIWYWNEKVVAIEAMPMPTVKGDGKHTLRELILLAPRTRPQPAWEMCEGLARYQDLTLDIVIPAGQEVLVEIRFMSQLHAFSTENQNVIGKYRGTALMKTLEAAGPVFLRGIPESVRKDTLFTVDAIIDAQQTAWYLEMNCNSAIHPDAYAAIFESLLGPPGAGRTDWSRYPPTYSTVIGKVQSLQSVNA